MNKSSLFLILFTILFSFSCKKQIKQLSPIDISKASDTCSLKAIFDDYTVADTAKLTNTGKSIKISLTGDYLVIPSPIDYTGEEVDLFKIEIKSPSEHSIKGKHYPLELQFVHYDTLSHLVIASVFVKEGKENDQLAKIIQNIPEKNKTTIIHNLDIFSLFQQKPDYYFYRGTTTTKPYKANVRWFVMEYPIEASAEQIKKIQQSIGINNIQQVDSKNLKICEYQ